MISTRLLKGLLCALCFLCGSGFSLSAAAADTLHLYNWNNYITPDTVSRFETFCGCRLVQDYYADNEEMLAKLAAGAAGYDILVPTGNAVENLIKQGALRPIDRGLLPKLG
ncbi:MAG: polyamine ABC transporter substrate-binding protein, partial [Burkholderiales bacterium]